MTLIVKLCVIFAKVRLKLYLVGEGQDAEVVVQGPGVVVWVEVDGGHGDVSLPLVLRVEMVAAHPDLHVTGHLPVTHQHNHG